MSRMPSGPTAVVLVLASGAAAWCGAPVEKRAAGKQISAREIAALLLREDFPRAGASTDRNRMTIRDVLQAVSNTLSRKSGGEVGCLLDVNAFKAENEESTREGLLGEEVDLAGLPGRRTLAAVLDHALRQLPSRNAAYLVRRGCVEVTTVNRASVRGLLERKVLAIFERRPLEDALTELSEQTGASIVVDGRVGDELRTPVTATFLNDASLGGALRLLTDMAGLRVVVVESTLYVTTPRNARKLRQELEHPLVPPAAPLALPGAG